MSEKNLLPEGYPRILLHHPVWNFALPEEMEEIVSILEAHEETKLDWGKDDQPPFLIFVVRGWRFAAIFLGDDAIHEPLSGDAEVAISLPLLEDMTVNDFIRLVHRIFRGLLSEPALLSE